MPGAHHCTSMRPGGGRAGRPALGRDPPGDDRCHGQDVTGGPRRGCPQDAGTHEHTQTTPAVRLGGVTKDFGDVHAVRGIDLEIQPGEMVAFLGPNGAGKTTTIDMVLGLSHPTPARSRCSAWPRATPSPAASSPP